MSYKNALIDWFSKLLHVAAIVSHTFHHIFKFIVATAAYRLFLLINRQNMLFVFHERYNWDIGMGDIFISLIRTLCEILSVEFFIYLLKIDSKNNTFELRTFKLMKISKKKVIYNSVDVGFRSITVFLTNCSQAHLYAVQYHWSLIKTK